MNEKPAIVQYLPKYASARKTPINGVIEQVPDQFVTLFDAVTFPWLRRS